LKGHQGQLLLLHLLSLVSFPLVASLLHVGFSVVSTVNVAAIDYVVDVLVFFVPAVAGVPVIAADINVFAFSAVVLGLLLPSSLLLLSSSLLLLSSSLLLLSSSLLLLSSSWTLLSSSSILLSSSLLATISFFMLAHILFLAAAADDVPGMPAS
jgi:hypothetical protein